MPWKECHVMDERLRFVARLLDGDKMAPLCAEFAWHSLHIIRFVPSLASSRSSPHCSSETRAHRDLANTAA